MRGECVRFCVFCVELFGEKVSHRNFVSTAMARKTAITTRVVELVHQVLGKGIHITKRDMFYTDVKLFKDQSESDNVLDDVACMVGCTRSCLNVVASDKGLVVGRVTFLEDGARETADRSIDLQSPLGFELYFVCCYFSIVCLPTYMCLICAPPPLCCAFLVRC